MCWRLVRLAVSVSERGLFLVPSHADSIRLRTSTIMVHGPTRRSNSTPRNTHGSKLISHGPPTTLKPQKPFAFSVARVLGGGDSGSELAPSAVEARAVC